VAVAAANTFVFRGMTEVENGVIQPDLAVDLPTKADGILRLRSAGNIDLSDDVGDAWYPDDNQLRFSEVEYALSWNTFWQGLDWAVGLDSYNLLNGLEFPNGVRGSTNELFVTAARSFGAWTPRLELHYDYDEVDGLYVKAAVVRGFELAEHWIASGEVGLAYSDENSSEWQYGIAEAGLADATLRGSVGYQIDAHTDVSFGLLYSSMVDSDLSDQFEGNFGIDPDVFVASLTLRWSY
jgi:hypothetical protein